MEGENQVVAVVNYRPEAGGEITIEKMAAPSHRATYRMKFDGPIKWIYLTPADKSNLADVLRLL